MAGDRHATVLTFQSFQLTSRASGYLHYTVRHCYQRACLYSTQCQCFIMVSLLYIVVLMYLKVHELIQPSGLIALMSMCIAGRKYCLIFTPVNSCSSVRLIWPQRTTHVSCPDLCGAPSPCSTTTSTSSSPRSHSAGRVLPMSSNL